MPLHAATISSIGNLVPYTGFGGVGWSVGVRPKKRQELARKEEKSIRSLYALSELHIMLI